MIEQHSDRSIKHQVIISIKIFFDLFFLLIISQHHSQSKKIKESIKTIHTTIRQSSNKKINKGKYLRHIKKLSSVSYLKLN